MNLFDRSLEQEFTWQSKHIKYFLSLKNLGPAAVEKIIEINPDIDQWDRDYVAGQTSNYQKFSVLLPEEIPELEHLDGDMVINFKDKHFPENLKNMKKDKPLLLWYKGNLNIGKSIAVVGSRNMIPETAEIVDDFVERACEEDFNIISGLAIGVDTQAHKAALKNNAKTVAILPSSLDNIVPSQNKDLAYEIIEKDGLLLSEYPIGSPKKPEPSNYIQRNRLQAGISDAVFIAQSGIPGGTMTTAKHAIDNEKKLIVYLSENILKEYQGNKYLTETLSKNYDFSVMKFNKSQIEVLITKNTIADKIITSGKNEIQEILNFIQ
jgi:DNA protecting protein DprA